jgi:hypothetical protein
MDNPGKRVIRGGQILTPLASRGSILAVLYLRCFGSIFKYRGYVFVAVAEN